MTMMQWHDVHSERAPLAIPDGTQIALNRFGTAERAFVFHGVAHWKGKRFDTLAALANAMVATKDGEKGSVNAWKVMWMRRPDDVDWYLADWHRMSAADAQADKERRAMLEGTVAARTVHFPRATWCELEAIGSGEGAITYQVDFYIERMTEGA